MMTYDEVMQSTDNYFRDPTPERLTDILTCAAPLSGAERAAVIQQLMKFASMHGMTKRELTAELHRLMESADGNGFYEEGTLRPIRVVKKLCESETYLHTVEDGALRVYRDGVYQADRTRNMQRSIINLLGDKVTPYAVDSVMSLLRDSVSAVMPSHPDWINLQNGRLCTHSFEVLPHDPAFASVVQLPVTYNPSADCPAITEWLADVLPDEADQLLLLQLIGYSMLQDVRFGKIVVLYGPTHTGKSTCLDLLKHFLGVDNVSALSLHALDDENNRFARAGLVGKLANVSADLSSKYLSGDSQVKQIAVGDSMQVEYKGIQGFTSTLYCTLWSSANQLPVSHDRTDAWYERLVILPFTQQHKGEKADRKLLQKLTAPDEMSGLLNMVIRALRKLITDNVFHSTKSTDSMLAQYRLENDHVSRYLSETCELVAGERVDESELYTQYVEWCTEEGIKQSLSKSKFRDGVKAWGGKHKRANENGSRFFVFDGIRFQ